MLPFRVFIIFLYMLSDSGNQMAMLKCITYLLYSLPFKWKKLNKLYNKFFDAEFKKQLQWPSGNKPSSLGHS